MIEQEVGRILERGSSSMQARMLGDLTDEFRSGRNPQGLLELINSSDKNIIWVGIYIIGEISIKNHVVLQLIVERLQMLVEHSDSKIRHSVLMILGSLLEEIDPNKAKELFLKMSQDNDDVIRSTAKDFLDQ